MRSAFGSPTLPWCVLCGVSALTLAPPAAAQSSWFGVSQTAAVNDPRAAACVSLALGKPEPAHGFNPNGLAGVAETFDLTPVFDAVATCRIALRAFPAEPKVIVAHYNAAFTLSVILFGFKDFPQTDEDAVQKARAIAAADNSFSARMADFFLGSACEYGVGTPVDLQEAAKWYSLAADAGDTIAKRELSRIRGEP
jgi:TPR repeat protein